MLSGETKKTRYKTHSDSPLLMSFLTTVAPAVKVENENPKGLMAGLGAKQIAKNMQSNAFLSGTKRGRGKGPVNNITTPNKKLKVSRFDLLCHTPISLPTRNSMCVLTVFSLSLFLSFSLSLFLSSLFSLSSLQAYRWS